MRKFCQPPGKFSYRWKRFFNLPMMAMGEHCIRFATAVLLALLMLGSGAAAFDWSEDARWELRNQDGQSLYRLDATMEELGIASNGQEMFILPAETLLVRQRNNRSTNLTVLKGYWDILRNGKVVGTTGRSWEEWQAQLGEPLAIFVNPQKVGKIYYFRASLLDLGLMVADGKVLSAMFMEPGYLRSALERSGYSPKQ